MTALPRALVSSRLARLTGVALLLTLNPLTARLFAGTDTWTGAGATTSWSDNGNWSSPPAAGDDLAFGAVAAGAFTTSEDVTGPAQIGSIAFTSAAAAFTLNILPGGSGSSPHELQLAGAGISNDSSNVQRLVAAGASTASGSATRGGVLDLANSAALGNVLVTSEGGSANNTGYGELIFEGSSTAGSATIVDSGGPGSGDAGGVTLFSGSATAGAAAISVQGGTVAGGTGGEVEFANGTDAGTATFNVSGGNGTYASGLGTAAGDVLFFGAQGKDAVFFLNGATASGAQGARLELNGYGTTSTIPSDAGSATIICSGSSVAPDPNSPNYSGGTVAFTDSSAGTAAITAQSGSAGGAGGGVYFNGAATADNATVTINAGGLLDLSGQTSGTLAIGALAGAGTFNLASANLQVGSAGIDTTISGSIVDTGTGTRGSLTKAGFDTLTLTGASLYGGGTVIAAGTLLVDNATGSGTGAGSVQIQGGTLGGTGFVSGPVVNMGGVFSPGTLTLGGAYTQQANGTLLIELGGTGASAYDHLVAAGAVTLGGTLHLVTVDGYSPQVGDTFSLIQGASVTGTFAQVISPGITVSLTASSTGLQATVTGLVATSTTPVVSNLAVMGYVGQPFSFQITATNTPTNYTASGLPAGLTVNAATGLINGTPTAAGTFSVNVTATNSTGTGTGTLNVTIGAAPTGAPTITSATQATAILSAAFSYQISATPVPASFGATNLPAGLSVNASTGLISGTPTAPGVFAVALSATNAYGTGTASLTLTVSLPVATIAATSTPVTVGSGNIGEFTVTLSGASSATVIVNYTVHGHAENGVDYVLLTGHKKFKPGKLTKPIKIIPISNLEGAASRGVKIVLAAGDGYTVGAAATAKVKILVAP